MDLSGNGLDYDDLPAQPPGVVDCGPGAATPRSKEQRNALNLFCGPLSMDKFMNMKNKEPPMPDGVGGFLQLPFRLAF
jgi:hypothetical protein